MDGHIGSVETAGRAATAAVTDHKNQCGSTCRPVSWGEAAGQSGRGGLGCFHCTEGRVQRNIQNPERRKERGVSQLFFSS